MFCVTVLGVPTGRAPSGRDSEACRFDLLQSAKTQGETLSELPFVKDRYVMHRGRGSLFAVRESGDSTHPSYEWARDHHEPHFGLVEGAAAMHDELMRAFRAEVGPLDDQKAVEALTIRA